MSIFSSVETSDKPLKLLFVGSEAAPYAQVGGLGEVMRSLPKAFRELGHDARVFVPRYASIDGEKFQLELEVANLPMAGKEADPYGLLVCNVLKHRDESGSIVAYFLENMEYYEKRANIYGYKDDTARWLLLSKGAVEFVKKSSWKPDVIISGDWQAGFVANILETEYKDDPELSKIATVFSIHNLKHQGMFEPRFISEIDYDSGQGPINNFFDENIWKLNGARRGLLYSDVINTVSPTYAKEILLPENGEMLDAVLKEKRDRLYGILNGLDYEIFNSETDKELAENYSAKNLKGREVNKSALQKKIGLPENKDIFVISFIGRLDEQKGIGLIREIAESLLQNIDFQFVFMGTGDNDFMGFLQDLQRRYPQRVALNLSFGAELRKLVLAGSDTMLVPSIFEPCGLVQMEAMRYGCIPIVRRVGGLADSVVDFNPASGEGTGFVFNNYDRYAFLIAIIRSYETYRNKKEWKELVKRAMTADFSWRRSASEYLKLFESAIALHKEHQNK